jgi:phenylacetate-CoA ligase
MARPSGLAAAHHARARQPARCRSVGARVQNADTRHTLWDRATSPELAELPARVAMVAAQHATHMTGSLADTFANPRLQVARFPVTLPIEHIVAGLNDYQPVMLGGYPTALSLLAEEARAGRLHIEPKRIMATSEPLLAETRLAIEHAFDAPVANGYGTSEGGAMAVGCWRGPGMHVCDDLVIIEPVDADGRPVPTGVESDKIYITALANPTLPLIRFELSDRVTFLEHACPCGSAHRLIADVEGRLDDAFSYPDGVVVHPHVFRSVLGRVARVVEYQVRQTAVGADIFSIGTPNDLGLPERELCRELAVLGVRDPVVTLRAVDALERQPTGKIRRFVPNQDHAGRESSSTIGDGTRRRSF